MDWIPLSLKVLDNGEESENLLMAAVHILDQVTLGFDEEYKNLENARKVVELGGVELIVKRLENGNNVKEKQSCASILTACIRAQSSCRVYLAANINKKSVLELFFGSQLKSRGSAIYLLCELLCFKRMSQMMEFINKVKNIDELNAMHVLLVYLQQAPKEQRPLAAVILLLLDLSDDSSHGSLYREEGIDAIITALERSLHNKKLHDQCSKALLILGGRFDEFGNPVSEILLLKRAGLSSFHDDLVRDKANSITNSTNLEEEEKRSTYKWLRKVAMVMLEHGNKRLVVALSNCIADGTSGLARSCLVTIAWMSSSLHNSKGCRRVRLGNAACNGYTCRKKPGASSRQHGMHTLALGSAYARGDHITREHIIVHWIAPIQATVLALWTFKLFAEQQKSKVLSSAAQKIKAE